MLAVTGTGGVGSTGETHSGTRRGVKWHVLGASEWDASGYFK